MCLTLFLGLLQGVCSCASGPRLTVSVLDLSGSSSTPLKGVKVQVRGSESNLTRETGKSGSISFKGLEVGSYEIEVQHPGYSSIRESVQLPRAEPLLLSIHRVFTVTGQLLLADGKAVVEADVSFLSIADGQLHQAQVDASGYRVERLEPGRYQVRATSKDQLYATTIDEISIRDDLQQKLILEEVITEFDMPTDEPHSLEAPARPGRIPKQ